jgi:hypothetical protein
MPQIEVIHISPYPSLGKALSLGISVRRDMIVLALVGDRCLQNVEYFIHKSGHAMKACPYYENFRDEMNIYGEDFNVSRVLQDAIRNVEIVGFDPSEIKLSSKTNNLFTITKDEPQLTDSLSCDLSDTHFLSVMSGSTDTAMQKRAQITQYFWDSLRADSDGNKKWTEPSDRLDPMLAVARAYTAIRMRHDREEAKLEEPLRRLEQQVKNGSVTVVKSNGYPRTVPIELARDLVRRGEVEVKP